MLLFFDTETTGIPAGADHIYMVQLAWILTEDHGEIRAQGDSIVKPDGWVVPDAVVQFHGISTERALAEGHPVEQVLLPFVAVLRFGPAIALAGHNTGFDCKIVAREFERLGWENELHGREVLDTMRSATEVCNLPRKGGGRKPPKLAELYRHLFKCDFEEQHNARADIAATAKCFWELRRRGVM